jgi:hypothetical protein
MIPERPTTAPAAHIHFGTRASWSSTFHTGSGMASAESMAGVVCKVRWLIGRQLRGDGGVGRGWCTVGVLFTRSQRLVEHGHWVNAQETVGKYHDSSNPR